MVRIFVHTADNKGRKGSLSGFVLWPARLYQGMARNYPTSIKKRFSNVSQLYHFVPLFYHPTLLEDFKHGRTNLRW
jgi:hypothetical protein